MNLQKHFEDVQDFRVQGRCWHELSDILIIVLLGTLADCHDFPEMEDYAKDKEAFLRTELGLQLRSGIPSEDTLGRVLRFLKPAEVEKSLRSACQEVLATIAQKHIRLDGKELRGTIPPGKKHAQVQVLSAWIAEESISFGQLQIAEKSNEITAIPQLLDALDCAGSIISIDAIACQKTIVEKIVARQADYVIALKENQGALYEQLSEYVLAHRPHLPQVVQRTKDRDRGEQRTVYVAPIPAFLEAAHEWKSLHTVVLVESIRCIGDQQTHSKRFYISSLTDEPPARYAGLIRGHWGIENGLHWHLDLTFREDDSRVRKGNGPLNLNIFRKFSLFLLTQEPSRISLKRKRKKAARDDGFMLELLKSA